MTIGEKIYKLRKAKGWSQDYLAEQLGVSRQAVSRWELDDSAPELQKVYKLSALFSVSCDYLLNEQQEVPTITVPQEISTAKKHPKYTKIWVSVLSVVLGVMILGTLAVLSAIVPSYTESRQEISREDIAFAYDIPTPDWVPEQDVVTTRIEVHDFLPFLSTYHLFWLAGIAVCLIIYGSVSLAAIKIKVKKGIKK